MNEAEADLLAEHRRLVVRHFQPYTSEERSSRAASHRMGHRARTSTGEYFYTHPDLPGVAFPSRTRAAREAIRRVAAPERGREGKTK